MGVAALEAVSDKGSGVCKNLEQEKEQPVGGRGHGRTGLLQPTRVKLLRASGGLKNRGTKEAEVRI